METASVAGCTGSYHDDGQDKNFHDNCLDCDALDRIGEVPPVPCLAGNCSAQSTYCTFSGSAPQASAEAFPKQLSHDGNMVSIMVVLNFSNFADLNPKLKLVSIDSTEPIEEGDVQDAAIGTDDREFLLRASKNGTTRLYTASYEVTDAAGNTVTTEAIITIK